MRLYIIRHGDPDYENNTITTEGHKEAAALSKRLSSQGLDRIFCSPLGRAIDTMKYTTDILHLNYEIEDWLYERPELFIDDEKNGFKAMFQFPGETIRSGCPLPTHDTWYKAEMFKNNRAQVMDAVDKIRAASDSLLDRLGYERQGGVYSCKNPNCEKVAVFCHAGTALTWLSHLLEIPVTLMWSGFWLPPSSVTTILFEERSKEWAVPRCLGLGDISHLYEAGLTESSVGLEANCY